MLNEYVSRIEEACGTEKDFVVILKYAKKDEAMKKILEKCVIRQRLSGVLIKGVYRDKEVSVFRTGKVIIRGLKERTEAEQMIEELLTQ